MTFGKPPTWVLIKAHLLADRRKTAVLAVLGLIMAGVYGRLMFRGPQRAAAEGIAIAATVATSQPAAERQERVFVAQSLARELATDPFALDLDKYPRSRTAGSTGPELRGRADEKIRSEAAGLALQSTLSGNDPLACINGQFLRPGDRISGFVLKGVEPRRVVLEREGVQVALYLK